MSDNEKVVVPVEMTREEAEKWARYNDPLGTACRAWLADNPEPEREVLRWHRWQNDRSIGAATAVPVEALRPGDRVAGRVVLGEPYSAERYDEACLSVRFDTGEIGYAMPGTLVLLDPEDGDQ